MSRGAALALLRGEAQPVVVTLAMSVALVGYWERAFDQAVDELVDATTPADEAVARHHLCAVGLRLDAACARRDRLDAERQGRRWLRLVGGGRA